MMKVPWLPYPIQAVFWKHCRMLSKGHPLHFQRTTGFRVIQEAGSTDWHCDFTHWSKESHKSHRKKDGGRGKRGKEIKQV